MGPSAAIFNGISAHFDLEARKIFLPAGAKKRADERYAPFLKVCGAKFQARFLMVRFLNARDQLYLLFRSRGAKILVKIDACRR